MLKKVFDLFDQSSDETEASRDSVELATAALFSEIVHADNTIDEREKEAYREVLKRHFTLDQQALDSLAEEGHETADDSVGLVHFTQIINK